jgi:hypothetical protein
MSFKADIKVDLKINEVQYNINLGIPTAAPTDIDPYKFDISQKGKEEAADAELLNVAVGAKGHFYVAVSPPEEILSLTSGVVEDLEVVVNDGEYDPSKGQFDVSTPPA